MKKSIILFLFVCASLFLLVQPDAARASAGNRTELRNEIRGIFLNQDNSKHSVLKYKVKTQELIQIINEVSHEPDIVVVCKSSNQITRKFTNSGLYVSTLTYTFPKNISSNYNALRKIVDEVNTKVLGMSDIEKLLYVHDYIIYNCAYNTKSTKDDSYAYSTLVLGHGICGGYTEALAMFCDIFGIKYTQIDGNNGGHLWLQVEIDEQYYHIDATWDDPYYDVKGRVLHSNFMVNDTMMLQSKHYGWTQPYKVDMGNKVCYVERNYEVSNSNRLTNWFVYDVYGRMLNNDNTWIYINENKQIASINSINLVSDINGLSEKVVVNEKVDALDIYKGRLIYSSGTNIYVCNIDGTERKLLFKTNDLATGKYNVVKYLHIKDDMLTYTIYCYESENQTSSINSKALLYDLNNMEKDIKLNNTVVTVEQSIATRVSKVESNTQRNITVDTTVKSFYNFSNIEYWMSGSYSNTNGMYCNNNSRICLNKYFMLDTTQKYIMYCSKNEYRIIICELDSEYEHIKSTTLRNGSAYTPQQDSVYFAISIYNSNSEGSLNFTDYQNLFMNGFKVRIHPR